MAYVPDISGFLQSFGSDSNLIDILDKEVPRQLEFRYSKNDITEFESDMHFSIKAEDGLRVRLIVDNRTVSVVLVRNPSNTLRRFYNSRGYLIRTPVFETDGDPKLICVCYKNEKVNRYFLSRYIKIKGSNEHVFLLRIWSQNTPSYIAPSKFELIPI